MAFGIPDLVNASFPSQAQVDAVDFDVLVAGQNLTGVQYVGGVLGCAVTQQGSPYTTVAVAAGTVRIAGRKVSVTGANVTIAANSSGNTRFDLITVDTSGTLADVQGTAAVSPVFPTVPASQVAIAAIYVAN